ncbi:ribosome biogenesis GTPase Der [Myroides odoratimimus]|uniref:ribosome biogenesis GTPase Der n=1 Tax=Myroides odoratimimus TaxID=76832 RepID=UPI001038E2A5|nr:ribosome biogenesis GTPase Der [Myroides odoratimimus]MCA4791733.1 ribosome biogenesis GTPase Der [Myroides odoratimimus]MCA4805722.1 ribosome biogenesis GTPase Der [Myroides odoratimimus]MCA4818994.1 ribosome biogenesis GTPase Der [Myroides odoratimimus]MDM1059101.1 ribosome biogenesis GTPase Der [Myroides odoratimimus]MDM1091811.1 ribosome biogenesis GTPase Der [Myroides odoratimimus]
MSSIVAIVGRPNVGKSTFFNRLIQRRDAIVDSVSGVTRDRNYGKSEWNGREFSVIDTGGYIKGSDDVFEGEIRRQVSLAIEECDVVIFVVDVEEGITPMDAEVARLLRKETKPVFVAVNKVDSAKRMDDTFEFYNLGLGEIYPIAGMSGSGTGDLLDAVVAALPEEEVRETEEEELPRFCVVGRPNAGKSSFINALIGEDRYIVTDIAGTTRDAIDTRFTQFGFDFNLVDTAGIRRKSKVKEDLEFYSVMRSVRAIEHSDVCILMVDATRGFEGQDQNIFWLAEKNRKGIVILVNKWDLVEKDTMTTKQFEDRIREEIAPFTDVPIVFTSTVTKQRLLKALETAVEVYENRKARISTSKFNEAMLPIVENTPPPAIKGKYIKIKYCMQLPTATPQFVFFANLPQYIKDPYKRYIENKLREMYNFSGVPIDIYFRQK